MGCRVTVLPGVATADEVLAQQPDGVFLSNGPGDPEPLGYAQQTIRGLLGKKPIFGICLGHQLLALACGAKTYKLKFGHRGANQPVMNNDNRPRGDHHAESRLRGRWRFAARRVGSDALELERQHDRRRSPPNVAGLQRAVPPGSLRRPARQQLSLQPISGDVAVSSRNRSNSPTTGQSCLIGCIPAIKLSYLF